MPVLLRRIGPASMKGSLKGISLAFCLLAATVAASVQELLAGFKGAVHRCPDPYGEYSPDQERFIDALNGKKVVFIGDSITRYQYLELASFLTHGLCVNATDPGEHGYYLSHQGYSSWHEFYTKSSDALNFQSALLNTREMCLCARIKLAPGYATEHRTYTYHDNMDRRIELAFIMYLSEEYLPLKTVLGTAENLRPTDVVMNYGMWLSDTETNCGRGNDGATGSCPSTPGLCSFFTKRQHPYRTIWMTTTPVSRNGTIRDPLGERHHLNIPNICGLRGGQVVNRAQVLHTLEPNAKKKEDLWWDPVHFHAQASHAFNGALIEKILSAEQRSSELKAQRARAKKHT